MDSMVNRYTSDRRLRHNDAYTPDGEGGKRPDRAVIVYAQRCREAFPDAPIVLGGIEASLRRIAHYDYWSDKVRRSILLDAKADLLLYGNAERALVEVAHRLAETGEHRLRGPFVPTICAATRRSIAARRPTPGGLDSRRLPTIVDAAERRRSASSSGAPNATDRHPPAVLRAGRGRPGALCPRLARAAPGNQSRQRPRRWCSATATATCG